mmetsp:Transcript_12325/g.33713  ORF Transcript_12325/g.33713 Transcript_12325/m.33713 type:complete len:491 (+) Transcript_12325:118-1590(+)
MGAGCCTAREMTLDDQAQSKLWLKKTSRETAELRAVFCSARGFVTIAKRTFLPGDIIIHELPIALLYPASDSFWLAGLRQELEQQSPQRAWQFCVAAHCLAEADLPMLPPSVLRPLDADEVDKVMELSAVAPGGENEGPSAMAAITARHIMAAAHKLGEDVEELADQEECLALRLDAVASRVARHAYRVKDKTTKPPADADALFYRGSFVGTCHGGAPTAVWDFNGSRKTLTITAVRLINGGEEVTVDPASKTWLPRVEQDCSCSGCCRTGRSARRADVVIKPSVVGEVVEDVAYCSGSTEAETDDAPEVAAKAVEARRKVARARTKYGRFNSGVRGGSFTEADEEEEDPGDAAERPQVAKAPVEAREAEPDVKFTASMADPSALRIASPGGALCKKLDGLALEWGGEYSKPLVSPSSAAERSTIDTMSVASQPVVCASEDARLERLLQKCTCEGLTVSREHAESLLREEGGQVRKALIAARRVCASPRP